MISVKKQSYTVYNVTLVFLYFDNRYKKKMGQKPSELHTFDLDNVDKITCRDIGILLNRFNHLGTISSSSSYCTIVTY